MGGAESHLREDASEHLAHWNTRGWKNHTRLRTCSKIRTEIHYLGDLAGESWSLHVMEATGKMASPKRTPKDAEMMAQIQKDTGITEYEPKVINQMLEFAF